MRKKQIQVTTYKFYPKKHYIIEVVIREDNTTEVYIIHDEYGTKLFYEGFIEKDSLLNDKTTFFNVYEGYIENSLKDMINRYEEFIEKIERE